MLQYLGIVMIKQQGYEYLEKMVQRDARFGLHGALTKKNISVEPTCYSYSNSWSQR